jgi:hypothetical protein
MLGVNFFAISYILNSYHIVEDGKSETIDSYWEIICKLSTGTEADSLARPFHEMLLVDFLPNYYILNSGQIVEDSESANIDSYWDLVCEFQQRGT